jgi:hypothetical protein
MRLFESEARPAACRSDAGVGGGKPVSTSPSDFFFILARWLESYDLPLDKVHVTLRLAPETEASFMRHWQFDLQQQYKDHGHRNPQAVTFPIEGTFLGIPFKIERTP